MSLLFEILRLSSFTFYLSIRIRASANGFRGMAYGQGFFKPMLEVFDYLKANGFTYQRPETTKRAPWVYDVSRVTS